MTEQSKPMIEELVDALEKKAAIAASAKILALYERQREENYRLMQTNGQIAKQWADGEDRIVELSSQLERLKADSLTDDERNLIADQLEFVVSLHPRMSPWPPIIEKLRRRLSQSSESVR